MYHRVADAGPGPWAMNVSPRRFDEHLEVLARRCRPLRLEALAESLREGRVPGRSFAITFDDGYADTLKKIRPALERLGIPATIFLPVEAVRSGRPFWWDELEGLFFGPGELPGPLSLRIGGATRTWEVSGAEARRAAFTELYNLLRPLKYHERLKTMEELNAWAGGRGEDYRPLSTGEVSSIAEGGLIDIGSHTLTHPDLTTLQEASLREEIVQGKAALEEMTGRPVKCFAYPFGLYNPKAVAVVRDAGFECACAASGGAVASKTDRFVLPRLMVEDWGGDEFETRLGDWLYG